MPKLRLKKGSFCDEWEMAQLKPTDMCHFRSHGLKLTQMTLKKCWCWLLDTATLSEDAPRHSSGLLRVAHFWSSSISSVLEKYRVPWILFYQAVSLVIIHSAFPSSPLVPADFSSTESSVSHFSWTQNHQYF